MNGKNKLEQLCEGAPGWVGKVLPLISAVVGGTVLWATWYFYKDLLTTSDFPWFGWIQPALMVLGGILILIAAALLAVRIPAGYGLLEAAIGIIPMILFLRLVIVILIFIGSVIGWIGDGTFLNQLSMMSPIGIAKTLLSS